MMNDTPMSMMDNPAHTTASNCSQGGLLMLQTMMTWEFGRGEITGEWGTINSHNRD